MKVDKGFDFSGFDKKTVLKTVEVADRLFQEQFNEGNLLLCTMDQADVIQFEAATGQKILDAAKELILSYSKDGTLESGLKILTEKSNKHNGPDLVGYLLLTSIRK